VTCAPSPSGDAQGPKTSEKRQNADRERIDLLVLNAEVSQN
jgi:hypothetical protein